MAEISAFSLADYSREARAEIQEALAGYTAFDRDCPDKLRDAIRHSLLGPGKRLRPLLVLMSFEAFGYDRGRVMPAACAVEMVHTYSLIHDDLPAMDDDDLRRGRPTCHAAFGEATAILAGDALLARAFEILVSDVDPPDIAIQCCRELGFAAGASALVGGQMDDLDYEQDDGGEIAQLEAIHRRKTGAMIRVSVRLGGIIGGADATQLTRLDEYGEKVGLGFQIVDDLLDVRGEESSVGKRTRKDSARGKLTFPRLLGVAESERRARQLIDEACAAVAPLGPQASGLEALARYVVERTH